MYASYAYLVPIVLVVLLLFAAIRILPEYKRGVVFFLGRFQSVKGPGLLLLIPAIQKMQVVDLRTVTLDVPEQDVISQDNVTVRVNAVLYFRVVDPEKAIIQVENFGVATSQLAQTTLRSVLGKHDLDEMLSERDRLNNDIQEILDTQTEAWGIKVANVEIKHVDLDESMIRAIARQAEAERERRAKVIHAEGELQASHKLVDAADVMASNSAALQLRYLQTLSDMSNKNASTIVFPLPMDIMDAFKSQLNKAGAAPTGNDTSDHDSSDHDSSDTSSSRSPSGFETPDNEA
ncbi:slipin family protein [Chromohalobacter sp. 296-RDG]|uniref:slipin family protein n=1 Tax=Chromohalobacter sp. 296-RDG TaxID=2994062 RepID=UPI002468D5DF|nr:slipin family protein [Chromohalobacter sp. 296-RDG]